MIETARDQGMQTLDQALQDMITSNKIASEEAFQITRDPDNLKKRLENS